MSAKTSHSSHPHARRGSTVTDEEIAAVTVVLATVASARSATAAPPEPAPPLSVWSDPEHRLRAPLRSGPGAWRASGLPR